MEEQEANRVKAEDDAIDVICSVLYLSLSVSLSLCAHRDALSILGKYF